MASAVEDVRRVVFFHDAADSEELDDEALRCEETSVSP